jgi:hypothetical protein
MGQPKRRTGERLWVKTLSRRSRNQIAMLASPAQMSISETADRALQRLLPQRLSHRKNIPCRHLLTAQIRNAHSHIASPLDVTTQITL